MKRFFVETKWRGQKDLFGPRALRRANKSILRPRRPRPSLSWTGDLCSPPGATDNKHVALFKRQQHFSVVPDGLSTRNPRPHKNKADKQRGVHVFLSDSCSEVTRCKVASLGPRSCSSRGPVKRPAKREQSGGVNKNERINRNKTFQTKIIPQHSTAAQAWWQFHIFKITTRRSPATTCFDAASRAAL